jgi:apolipoprotein N-acyltransferase
VVWPVAAVLASGVLYGCIFPPLGWRHLAWIALVPLFVALDGVSTRRALAFGGLWGLVAAYGVGDWFPRAVARYWQQPPAVGLALFFAVSIGTGALQYAAFAACFPRLTRPQRAATPWLVAAAWVAAELARARWFGGNPWALFGFSQAGGSPLVQVADLTGVYGVSFCLAAVNAGIAQWWTGQRDRRGLGVGLATVGAVLVYGVVRLRTLDGDTATPTRVAIVQAAQPVSGQWDPSHYGRNLDAYLRLTSRATTADGAGLVVWPESALTFFLEQEPAYRSTIARVLSDGGTELLTGGPRTASNAGFYNSAFVLGPDGAVRGIYDKQVLLPFGEYFPFGTERLVRRQFGAVRAFVPGAAGPPLPTIAGPVGVLICNEAFYPAIAAARVRDGAEWLVLLANDSWAGEPRYAAIAAAMASFRAVEVRRDVVRASTWGPSWVVDARGQTMIEVPTGVEATGTGAVRRRVGMTAYAAIGDAFAMGCVLLTALAGWAGARGRQKRRAPY